MSGEGSWVEYASATPYTGQNLMMTHKDRRRSGVSDSSNVRYHRIGRDGAHKSSVETATPLPGGAELPGSKRGTARLVSPASQVSEMSIDHLAEQLRVKAPTLKTGLCAAFAEVAKEGGLHGDHRSPRPSISVHSPRSPRGAGQPSRPPTGGAAPAAAPPAADAAGPPAAAADAFFAPLHGPAGLAGGLQAANMTPGSEFTLGSVPHEVDEYQLLGQQQQQQQQQPRGRRQLGGLMPPSGPSTGPNSARASLPQEAAQRGADAVRVDASPVGTSSSFGDSIDSDHTVMFPAADDGFAWAAIPRIDSDGPPGSCCAETAPLLARPARLPPGVDAWLGGARDAIAQWLTHTVVPEQPSRNNILIVQGDSGDAWATVREAKGADEPQRPLRRRLKLPSDVHRVEIFSTVGRAGNRQLWLSVTLNRPPIAFAALIAAVAAETVRTYLVLKELRRHGTARRDPFKDSAAEAVELWVQEALLAAALLFVFLQWVFGDFGKGRWLRYMRSCYGAVHCCLLGLSFAAWSVPWTVCAGTAGSANLCYAAAILAAFTYTLATAGAKVLVLDWVGVTLAVSACVLSAWLPAGWDDAAGNSGVLRTLCLIGSSLAGAIWVGTARKVRPHLPTSLLLLCMAVGGALGSYLLSMQRTSTYRALTGWITAPREPSGLWLELCGLRVCALGAAAWSVLYLPALPIVAGFTAQRVLAVCVAAAVGPSSSVASEYAPTPLTALAAAAALLGFLVCCDSGRKDRERRVELPFDAHAGGSGSVQSSRGGQQGGSGTGRRGSLLAPENSANYGSAGSARPLLVKSLSASGRGSLNGAASGEGPPSPAPTTATAAASSGAGPSRLRASNAGLRQPPVGVPSLRPEGAAAATESPQRRARVDPPVQQVSGGPGYPLPLGMSADAGQSLESLRGTLARPEDINTPSGALPTDPFAPLAEAESLEGTSLLLGGGGAAPAHSRTPPKSALFTPFSASARRIDLPGAHGGPAWSVRGPPAGGAQNSDADHSPQACLWQSTGAADESGM